MGREIERKFLLRNDAWRSLAKGTKYRQGYLSSAKECIVRVRVLDNRGYLTVKGIARGALRREFEYDIPQKDAEAMLKELCQKPIIEKNRYKIPFSGLVWEIDEFLGDNQGLIVAEVELDSEDQPFTKPDWIGEEVTDDPRYFNSNLIAYPFTKWRREM
jgi:CYTH domain-containing protein